MRGFLTREIRAAVGHSLGGGQSLHLHTAGVGKAAPGVFKRAVGGGQWIAHLFDQDTARLVATARALGVRSVVIDRPGEAAQHIDLCGQPLARAMAMCENAADLPASPGGQPAEFRQATPQNQKPEHPTPPREEMRFGNMGTMSKPAFPGLRDDGEGE